MGTEDKRNFIIFGVLSVLIFLGWSHFFPAPTPTQAPVQKTAEVQLAPSDASRPVTLVSRGEALQTSARIPIDAPFIKGSIPLTGDRIDDVVLTQYRLSPNKDSPFVTLLSPEQTAHATYAQMGWVASSKSVRVPDEKTQWQTTATKLTSETPITLTWDNGQGLVFERTIAVDKDYLISVTQKVTNNTNAPVHVAPYGQISRQDTPKTDDLFILHEGPVGYMNSSLIEYKYDKLKDKKIVTENTTGGWMGITDKYWLTALIPDQKHALKAHYRYLELGGRPSYQTDYMEDLGVLESGKSLTTTAHLFAGAKVLSLLDSYEDKLGVPHFDKAVDFGWFYLITKPTFYFLTFAYDYLGNFGVAILFLTLLLKLAFLPIANKQYRSMARMKDLQPKVKKLQERYADDKMRLNQEMMELYKREKVNPVSGCLPMLVQIPVFFALYKVIYISIEMRQAPFFGWIHDLSIPDPTTVFNLFGLIPWTPPTFLMLGAWPLIMGLTMWAQQKLNPAPTDPAQAKVFLIMPIMFTYICASFPAGLVIYWTWSNLLTIAQQAFIMSRATKLPHANKA
ncbi:MAG: membrane protein insertase YidC [Candidatus Puniceispirillum sp.]|nr:membrane protein insertase YidC [Candidatus Puniceispirillum sp.]